jgi:hypothetical protein
MARGKKPKGEVRFNETDYHVLCDGLLVQVTGVSERERKLSFAIKTAMEKFAAENPSAE